MNPQPPVLETGALPIELLPSGHLGAGARIVSAKPLQTTAGAKASLDISKVETAPKQRQPCKNLARGLPHGRALTELSRETLI